MAEQSEDYFTKRLDEQILKPIVDCLDLSCKLKLRTVFAKDQQDTLASLIKSSIRVVYVSPTKVSLRNFKRLSRSSFFSKHIDTVVFITQTLGRLQQNFDDIVSLHEYRKHKQVASLPSAVARQSFELYKAIAGEYKSTYSAYEKYGHAERDIPGDVHHDLESGFLHLINVKHIEVSTYIRKEGLNASCMWYHEEYSQERITTGQYTLCEDLAGKTAKQVLQWHTTDECVDALFHAIRTSRTGLHSLALGDGDQGQLFDDIQCLVAFEQKTLKCITRNLRKLTISCKDGDDTLHERSSLWKHIARGAKSLQELVIFTHRPWAGWQVPMSGPKAIDHFLEYGTYPALRTLRVHGNHPKPDPVNAALLQRFFRKHCDTLQNVYLDGIIFSQVPAPPDFAQQEEEEMEDVCETTYALLHMARDNLSELKVFEMKIHVRNEHGTDPVCSGHRWPGTGCDGSCESYLVHEGEWVHRSRFQALAVRLGAEIKGCDWDFGEFVMEEWQGIE